MEDMGLKFSSFFEVKIGSGLNTFFWFDNWTRIDELALVFPLLFDLDKMKYCFVEERVVGSSMVCGVGLEEKT